MLYKKTKKSKFAEADSRQSFEETEEINWISVTTTSVNKVKCKNINIKSDSILFPVVVAYD